jgi:hypothetical protein
LESRASNQARHITGGFIMRDTILASLFGLIGGATLALVYVARTGGF